MTRRRSMKRHVASLQRLGLDSSTPTDPLELLMRWSATPVAHVVIELDPDGVNRDLLPAGLVSARHAVAATRNLSRAFRRRVILVVDSCSVLFDSGTVLGMIDLDEEREP